MARRRARGRAVDGILVLNKAVGMTSNAALQAAKRLLFAQKAGHTGSLDPLATGVLPLCFGEATKFSQYLLDADKGYLSTFVLGVATETGDAEGAVIAEHDASGLTRDQVETALNRFQGEIEQVPSMYSALKHQGQPLYKLARQGVEVAREPRRVTIHHIEVTDFRPGPQAEVDLVIRASKGTYVRTLAEDLGEALGVGAHVSRLHRDQAGPFSDAEALTLEALEAERGEGRAELLDHHLLSPADAVAHLPELVLDGNSSYYLRQGQPVMVPGLYDLGDEGDMVRLHQEDARFLGVGEILDDGRVAPRRLVKHPVTHRD